MRKFLFLSVLIMNFLGQAYAGLQDEVFHVKYISAENIYLDSGSSDSLMVGDQLLVIRNGKSVAKLEIVYLADNSASCKILSQEEDVQVGDRVKMFKAVDRPEVIAAEAAKKQREFAQRSIVEKSIPWAKPSGSISLQWYAWQDDNITSLDFNQPSARMNLRLRRIAGSDLEFRFRMRSKYNERSRSLSSDIPQYEWLHRLYEASFTYEPDGGNYGVRAGRILTSNMSGIGYIDGAQFSHKVYGNFSAGLFGGTQPDYNNSSFSSDIQKYGLFVNYKQGDYSQTRYEFTLAAAGEYASGEVSREFLNLYSNVSVNNKWSLYQSMQVDLNRGWRADLAPSAVQISNFYISGNYRAFDWMNVALSYDTRSNYRTIFTKDTPAEFFDDEARHGVRAGLTFKLPDNYRIHTNFGMRMRSGVDNTYSYGSSIMNSNLLNTKLSVRAQVNGYINQFSTGINPGLSVGRTIWGGHLLHLSYGVYHYTFENNNLTVNNHWLRFDGDFNLISSLYSAIQYEYDWGGDLVGHRGLMEIGWRF